MRNILLLAVMLSGLAFAQTSARTKTFDLAVPLHEEFVGCINEKDALAFADTIAKQDEDDDTDAILFVYTHRRTCFGFNELVTYEQEIYLTKATDGEPVAVYRAKVRNHDVWVVMKSWRANNT